MMSSLLLIQTLMFAFTFWFGLYLLTQSVGKLSLRFAGLGLLSYAGGLAFVSLSSYAGTLVEQSLPMLLPLLPAGFWLLSTLTLLNETFQRKIPLRELLVPTLLIIFLAALIVVSGISRLVLAILPILLALAALVWIRRAFKEQLPPVPLKVLLTATLFFALGCVLLVIPVALLSVELILLLIGVDIVLLGYAVGRLDAYEEGTTLLPDALRSLLSATLMTAVIGSQTLILIALSGGTQVRSLLLFYAIVSTTIVLSTMHTVLQAIIDRLLFGRNSRITSEREALMAVSTSLPRLDEAVQPLALDEAELVRLTRRALSHYNNIGKLAVNPLTTLPIITERMRTNSKPDISLERAHELRRLLAECILRLKPYSDKDFDIGEEWRYFNALYFPYVLGLKPYTARASSDTTDATTQEVLAWFQDYVPERTLYNWQTSATRLIAQQLRETGQVAPVANTRQ
jgi:hypothetical protein